MKILHIYGQEAWHDDAFIIADREGLLALQKAVSEALEKGRGVAEVFVADGEGYEMKILLNDAEWPSDAWDALAVPYTADYARETAPPRGGVPVQPWDLWEREAGQAPVPGFQGGRAGEAG